MFNRLVAWILVASLALAPVAFSHHRSSCANNGVCQGDCCGTSLNRCSSKSAATQSTSKSRTTCCGCCSGSLAVSASDETNDSRPPAIRAGQTPGQCLNCQCGCQGEEVPPGTPPIPRRSLTEVEQTIIAAPTAYEFALAGEPPLYNRSHSPPIHSPPNFRLALLCRWLI